ncbi:MAG: hypothetical protein CL607_21105 [Anaerolineaceae bacterium]|nr:hypothetical protein [Anaerolineaceae bacterium]
MENNIRRPIMELATKNPTPIQALDVSPDGSMLLVGQHTNNSRHPNLSIWSPTSWQHIQDVNVGSALPILMARFSADGQTIALVDTDMIPRFYNLVTNETQIFTDNYIAVQWLSFGHSTDVLVVAGEQTSAVNINSGNELWSHSEKSEPNNAGEILPILASIDSSANRIAIAGGKNKQVSIFNLAEQLIEKTFNTDYSRFRWIDSDLHMKYLAAIPINGERLYLWDVSSGREVHLNDFVEEATGYWSLRFHPNRNYLALGMRGGYIVLINLSGRAYYIDENVHRGFIRDLCFTPDGRFLITGGIEGTVKIWDLEPIQ